MTRVLTPQTLRCPTTGKTAYASQERAEQVVSKSKTAAWNHNGHAPPRRAYECDDCGWWHLTKREARR